MRLSRPKWLESLIWRGGWKTALDDNCIATRDFVVVNGGSLWRVPTAALLSVVRRDDEDRQDADSSDCPSLQTRGSSADKLRP
jgi:hypothetical protein